MFTSYHSVIQLHEHFNHPRIKMLPGLFAGVLFRSTARTCPAETCAVILTGMGDDGALGMRSIRDGKGWTIAQDEATSIIYGMPGKAVAGGGVQVSLSLYNIAQEIVRVTTRTV